ncbi:MAG: hypothetical protein FJX76_27850 [Armatimonadetes bacterium]|nr:hypothetical protein [Armatimonadota bacterium]
MPRGRRSSLRARCLPRLRRGRRRPRPRPQRPLRLPRRAALPRGLPLRPPVWRTPHSRESPRSSR